MGSRIYQNKPVKEHIGNTVSDSIESGTAFVRKPKMQEAESIARINKLVAETRKIEAEAIKAEVEAKIAVDEYDRQQKIDSEVKRLKEKAAIENLQQLIISGKFKTMEIDGEIVLFFDMNKT